MKSIIGTLGPMGTCSEYCANYFMKQNNLEGELILYTTFEEAVEKLKESEVQYVIIPSAYVKFANILFSNLDKVKITSSFIYNTPGLVIAVKGEGESEIKRVATHPSPSNLVKISFPEAEIIYSTSNSKSAQMLVDGEVDAALTTEICMNNYKLRCIKNFGVVPMSWNVLERIDQKVNLFKCVSIIKKFDNGNIQEIVKLEDDEIIINKIGADSRFAGHSHLEAQVVYGLKGAFILGVEDEKINISENSIYYVGSNQRHSADPFTEFYSIDIKEMKEQEANITTEKQVREDETEIIKTYVTNKIITKIQPKLEVVDIFLEKGEYIFSLGNMAISGESQQLLDPLKVYVCPKSQFYKVICDQADSSLYTIRVLERGE
ncbi:prephenate dehydratase domain-containing protein [Cellulosilyticum ruminicola]|uniref:prephenate dehydratase domain-containing protein n=1 Tax=Cellulosilyticum ruminicola TaxID=425254 RepID=UPI0006D0528F|nr:prephenate dehydratase domain-containing protein [Cellulosilyticum ruminicola]